MMTFRLAMKRKIGNMSAKLPLTNDIKNFLYANYGIVRLADIAKHLGVSVSTVKVWGAQLHLTAPKTTKKRKACLSIGTYHRTERLLSGLRLVYIWWKLLQDRKIYRSIE